MNHDDDLTTAITDNLIRVAELLAPIVAQLPAPGDPRRHAAADALCERIEAALRPEFELLAAAGTLDELDYGTVMLMLGCERLHDGAAARLQ